ncbi:unnamed protein product [Ectocarpus sp. 8 AP-2014]
MMSRLCFSVCVCVDASCRSHPSFGGLKNVVIAAVKLFPRDKACLMVLQSWEPFLLLGESRGGSFRKSRCASRTGHASSSTAVDAVLCGGVGCHLSLPPTALSFVQVVFIISQLPQRTHTSSAPHPTALVFQLALQTLPIFLQAKEVGHKG